MIKQDTIVEKILAYLNGEFDAAALVLWSEDALVNLLESDEEAPNEEIIIDILGYIGAADSPSFPLTWEVLSGFLDQLGAKVRVTLAEKAG